MWLFVSRSFYFYFTKRQANTLVAPPPPTTKTTKQPQEQLQDVKTPLVVFVAVVAFIVVLPYIFKKMYFCFRC